MVTRHVIRRRPLGYEIEPPLPDGTYVFGGAQRRILQLPLSLPRWAVLPKLEQSLVTVDMETISPSGTK